MRAVFYCTAEHPWNLKSPVPVVHDEAVVLAQPHQAGETLLLRCPHCGTVYTYPPAVLGDCEATPNNQERTRLEDDPIIPLDEYAIPDELRYRSNEDF